MNRLNAKRFALFSTLTLLPVAALAATGGDVGGLCQAFCSALGFGC